MSVHLGSGTGERTDGDVFFFFFFSPCLLISFLLCFCHTGWAMFFWVDVSVCTRERVFSFFFFFVSFHIFGTGERAWTHLGCCILVLCFSGYPQLPPVAGAFFWSRGLAGSWGLQMEVGWDGWFLLGCSLREHERGRRDECDGGAGGVPSSSFSLPVLFRQNSSLMLTARRFLSRRESGRSDKSRRGLYLSTKQEEHRGADSGSPSSRHTQTTT